MPAFTARMGLYLPGGGSLSIGGDDEAADIDKINENFQKLDDSLGALPVDAGVRPSAPFPGQMISEPSTGGAFFWDNVSGQWRQLRPHVGTSAPSNPREGDLWVDTN